MGPSFIGMIGPINCPVSTDLEMLIIKNRFRAKQIVTPYLRSPIGKDFSPLNTVKEIVYGLVVGIPVNKDVERCYSSSPNSITDVRSPFSY